MISETGKNHGHHSALCPRRATFIVLYFKNDVNGYLLR